MERILCGERFTMVSIFEDNSVPAARPAAQEKSEEECSLASSVFEKFKVFSLMMK